MHAKASGRVNQVNIGGDNHGSIHFGQRREVSWPKRIGPRLGSAHCFQPRVALPEALAAGGTAVLTGLGGVGKTQIAARYAADRWDEKDLDLLLWITATSREQIIDGYAEAAGGLGLLDQPDTEPRVAADRMLNWLAETNKRWLVVIDDLAVPGHLGNLWPPETAGGVTVVTTRRRAEAFAGEGRQVIEVGMFSLAEACTYLGAKLATPPDDPDVAGLAEDLGRLPLALAQAAAYILDRGLTCAQYRARFADRHRPLTRLVPGDGELSDGYAAPLVATWELSIDAANALDPAGSALALLRLASLFDPNGIPVALFGTDKVLTWLAGSRAALNTDDVNDGLSNLHRLSLATVADDTVRVHALVQRATREAARRDLPAEEWTALVHTAADTVLALMNRSWRDTDQMRMVHGQALTLMEHDDGALWMPDGHPMLYGMGDLLGESGQVWSAVRHFHNLARIAAERLGPDHPDTLLARSRHALWLGTAGHPAEAAAELTQIIADRTRALGHDGEENFDNLGNRATFLGEAGDAQAAVREFERLVARRIEAHGPEDRRTLVTRHNLARWLGEAGDLRRAVREYGELVPLFIRHYGATDRATLKAHGELAAWRGELDPVAGAAELARLLPVEVLAYGPYHRRTLSTRRNLALLRGRAGRVTEAIRDLTALLDDCEKHLEPDHPLTFRARGDIVEWLLVRGDVVSAYLAAGELLADQSRALGEEDPATLRTREVTRAMAARIGEIIAGRSGSVPATLDRLAADHGTDADRVRRVLAMLVRDGAVTLYRTGPTGVSPADPTILPGHARFWIASAQLAEPV